MFPACGPIASTQPAITSSTAPGSTSTRSNSPRQPAAPRSTGCTPASDPFRFPTAVRTASMTYASGISNSFFGDSAENDGKILSANLLRRHGSARLIPAHRNPRGVADEPIHEVDVDVGSEITLVDPLVEQFKPHLALLPVAFLHVGEPRLVHQAF